MSSADDVLEMQTLSAELADRLAGRGAAAKVRIGAVANAIGVGGNRALEFIKGKARRVDAWEKEHAKRRLSELRQRERIERETEHLRWLECEIARHRASGEELRGQHIDGLLDALRTARGETGAMALSEAAND